MEDNETATQKILRVYVEDGICGIFKKTWIKVGRFLFYTTSSVWYERDLYRPVDHFTPEISLNTEILLHDKSRVINWLKENQTRFPWIYFEEEITSAIKNDHIYLMISNPSDLIGYVKIGLGHTYIHDFKNTYRFGSRVAFIYDTFVLPEYRGKKLALFALNQIAQYLKDNQFKKIICHIEKWNIPSIKTFEKAGFRRKDTIRQIRLASFPFFLRGGWVPVLDFENFLK